MAIPNESDTEATEKGENRGDTTGETTAAEEETEEEEEYITGVKLWLVLLSLTATIFLMLLDMSIVTTASFRIHHS